MKSNPTISVATIVKNERRHMDDFLSSLVGFADEIVIVDNGSTDGTVECIESFISSHKAAPVRLLTYSAGGAFHFGITKNFSIDSATKDYVIVLDADERLTDEFKRTVREFISVEKPLVATVVRKDELIPHLIDYPERIIRRDSDIRYGVDELARVHEQLIHDVPAKSFSGVLSHQQKWNHYVIRPQRIFFQLELQVERTPKTKSFLGHVIRGVWYFYYRFRKIYFTRKLYKDGLLGFRYASLRALDAFLVQLFVGMKPPKENEVYGGLNSSK